MESPAGPGLRRRRVSRLRQGQPARLWQAEPGRPKPLSHCYVLPGRTWLLRGLGARPCAWAADWQGACYSFRVIAECFKLTVILRSGGLFRSAEARGWTSGGQNCANLCNWFALGCMVWTMQNCKPMANQMDQNSNHVVMCTSRIQANSLKQPTGCKPIICHPNLHANLC